MGLTDDEKRRLTGGTGLPDLSKLPVRVSRKKAAELITQFFFETSPRSLERWPVPWVLINGRAHGKLIDIFAVAESKLTDATAVMGGRGGSSQRRIA
jgi:hypothetical protein